MRIETARSLIAGVAILTACVFALHAKPAPETPKKCPEIAGSYKGGASAENLLWDVTVAKDGERYLVTWFTANTDHVDYASVWTVKEGRWHEEYRSEVRPYPDLDWSVALDGHLITSVWQLYPVPLEE